jgi:hypothetical protein
MLDQLNDTLSRAGTRVARSIAEFLPGLLALAVILVVAVALAWIARVMVRRSFERLEFDKKVVRWGFDGVAEWSPRRSPTMLLAVVVQWFIILMGLLLGLSALDAAVTSALVYRLFRYLPDVLAAILIVTAGVMLARFAARGVLISAVNMQVQSARLLSLGVKWLVVVLAGAMALEHLGIGGQIVRLAFAILFGGIVLALALAVGLGSKDIVSRSLERQSEKAAEQDEATSGFHHL